MVLLLLLLLMIDCFTITWLERFTSLRSLLRSSLQSGVTLYLITSPQVEEVTHLLS